ncbi:MAG: carbonic anhydrase [Gemmataceae bacterium]
MAVNLRSLKRGRGALPSAEFERDPSIRGLLLTCLDDCFASVLLEDKLEPGYWNIQRFEAGAILPYGAGDLLLHETLERAVDECRVRQLVVCGHWPCNLLIDRAAAAHEWERLVEFQATGRVTDLLPACCGRLHVEHHLQQQLNHLRTYPPVAAALACGKLALHAWLHDDRTNELFFALNGPGTFTGRVALHPDHNRGLRAETRRLQPMRPPGLDPRDVYLS